MSYYNFKITNSSKEILMLSAQNPFYDNIIYWQLEKLLKIIEEGTDDIRMFISKIYSNTDYFNLSSQTEEPEITIDIDSKTITNPNTTTICKNVEQLNKEFPEGVVYRNVDGKIYAKWDEEKEYEITKIFFDDETIFSKKILTFDEFRKINTFINYLLDLGEIEYMLPSGSILRLNLA